MAAYDPTAKDAPKPIGEDGSDGTGERVAKALARAGAASRREVERLIEQGRVALNGQVLTHPAVKVGAGDILTVDGEVIAAAEPTRLFRYHKPQGLLTSHTDPKGRPTVFSALPPGLPRLISIGRLDLNSEGLLLLTNDGGLARALELPTAGLVRRYRARAFGRITQDKLDKLKDGITVEGVRYGSIEAKLDKAKESEGGANLWITVALTEGKNREVRRVFEAIGLQVNRLIRLSYGPFALGTLAPGEVEEVGPRVIREQLTEYIDPENMPVGDKAQYRVPAAQLTKVDEQGRPVAKLATRRGVSGVSGTALKERPEKIERKKGWAKPKPKKVFKGKPRPKGESAAKGKSSWGTNPTPHVQAKLDAKKAGGPRAGAAKAAPKRSPARSGPKPGPRGIAARRTTPKDKA
jgi:23S rRNA pseudouridine2605 synthase